MSKSSKIPRPETLRKNLLKWWDAGHRDLPWRKTNDPYPVWISEIMLQQTRIDTVIPYYNRFLTRLPTVHKLARAREHTVLKLWEGLGYYSRARNLQKTAKILVNQYAGRFPRSVAELQKLPGIGRYTAGAVASIAFDIPAGVLDGNIIRVLCRVYRIEDDPKKSEIQDRLWHLAGRVVCSRRPGELNQSMMELGALVCTPQNPTCRACPLKRNCLARRDNRQHDLPVRAAKKKLPQYTIAAGIVYKDGKILIDQRNLNGLLGGLWEFPGGKKRKDETIKQAVAREVNEETGVEIEVGKRLMIVRHTYSHFRIVLHAYICRYVSGTAKPLACREVRWVSADQLKRYAFPAANQRIIQKIEEEHRMRKKKI